MKERFGETNEQKDGHVYSINLKFEMNSRSLPMCLLEKYVYSISCFHYGIFPSGAPKFTCNSDSQ